MSRTGRGRGRDESALLDYSGWAGQIGPQCGSTPKGARRRSRSVDTYRSIFTVSTFYRQPGGASSSPRANRLETELQSSYENQNFGIQSDETLRSLLAIKDGKISALEKCVKELEARMRSELSVREAEISSLKTRLDSTDRTNQETKMHLEGNITRGGFKGQYVSPPPML